MYTVTLLFLSVSLRCRCLGLCQMASHQLHKSGLAYGRGAQPNSQQNVRTSSGEVNSASGLGLCLPVAARPLLLSVNTSGTHAIKSFFCLPQLVHLFLAILATQAHF